METFSRETPLDPNYVTGFVDGEGLFTFSRSGKQLSLYFAIKRPAGDEPSLQEIQSFFGGIGTIYTVTTGTKTSRYFRVARRDELMRVVDHFDRYPLRTIKREAFAIWRTMVSVKQQFRKPDRNLLDDLAARLSSVRLSVG